MGSTDNPLQAGVVPAHRVAMDTSLPWPEVLRPPANIQGTSSQAHLLAISLTCTKWEIVFAFGALSSKPYV